MVFFSLILSMAIILLLVSKKVNIGYSLMIGATLLALLNKKGLLYILQIIFETVLDSTTITLVVIVLLISILGHLMNKYEILDRMILALEKMLRSAKLTILLAPAIIGTLLVTGGALMSCPVVEKLGEKLDISKNKRAAINLIFRHALYFMFPLSTSIIMASKIGEFDVMDFVKLQFPISIAIYILGYIFYLRGHTEQRPDRISSKEYLQSIFNFIIYSSPILISLLGVIILNIPFYLSLIVGILVSIIINLYDKKHNSKYHHKENLLKTIYEGIKPFMIIAILGIMIYKNVVSDLDELYLQLNLMLEKGLPIELLIIIAASAISLSLGSTQPTIAILFPMILPLAPDYNTKLMYAMFIYTSGFLFYYISPIHLCQVLTLEYFDVKLKDLYKNYRLILPSIYVVMVIIYIINLR